MGIRRTAANRRRCNFPGCENETNSLHDISNQVRFKVVKRKKIYIPNGARSCEQHLSEIPWNLIGRNTIPQNSLNKFSAKQIEDLIQLLRNSGSNMVLEIPGEYNFDALEIY